MGAVGRGKFVHDWPTGRGMGAEILFIRTVGVWMALSCTWGPFGGGKVRPDGTRQLVL